MSSFISTKHDNGGKRIRGLADLHCLAHKAAGSTACRSAELRQRGRAGGGGRVQGVHPVLAHSARSIFSSDASAIRLSGEWRSLRASASDTSRNNTRSSNSFRVSSSNAVISFIRLSFRCRPPSWRLCEAGPAPASAALHPQDRNEEKEPYTACSRSGGPQCYSKTLKTPERPTGKGSDADEGMSWQSGAFADHVLSLRLDGICACCTA